MSESQSPSLGDPKVKVTRRGFLTLGAIAAAAAAWLAGCKPVEKVIGYATRPQPQEIVEGEGDPTPIMPTNPDLGIQLQSISMCINDQFGVLTDESKEFMSKQSFLNLDTPDRPNMETTAELFRRVKDKIPYKENLPQQFNEKPYWKAINPVGDSQFDYLRSFIKDRKTLLEELLLLFGKNHGSYFQASDFSESGRYSFLLPYQKIYVEAHNVWAKLRFYNIKLENEYQRRIDNWQITSEDKIKMEDELKQAQIARDISFEDMNTYKKYIESIIASNHDNQDLAWQYPDGHIVDNSYKPGICFSYVAEILYALDMFSGDEDRIDKSMLIIGGDGEFKFRDTLSIMSSDQSLTIKNLESAISLRCGKECTNLTGADEQILMQYCQEGYLIIGFAEDNSDPSDPYNHSFFIRQVESNNNRQY